MLWMVKIEKKYHIGEQMIEKGAKIKKPYRHAHLHIKINSHIYFQENPSSGLGGVVITKFF